MSHSPLYSDSGRTPLGSPRGYDSPPRYSRTSRDSDSDESLRALELSEGPLLAETPRTSRNRSYSVSGFDFQSDLLPLSASLSEPDTTRGESKDKHIGLVNGAPVESASFLI